MLLADIRDGVIHKTYSEVLPGKFNSDEATALLLTIGLQESRFETRQQYGGPAHSYWQFEKGGGVVGVLNHPATLRYAHTVCILRGITGTAEAVYARMLEDDLLGCAFARLLLYSDPDPLPVIGNVDGAWEYYLRNWRPGKPHRATWGRLYAMAIATLRGN